MKLFRFETFADKAVYEISRGIRKLTCETVLFDEDTTEEEIKKFFEDNLINWDGEYNKTETYKDNSGIGNDYWYSITREEAVLDRIDGGALTIIINFNVADSKETLDLFNWINTITVERPVYDVLLGLVLGYEPKLVWNYINRDFYKEKHNSGLKGLLKRIIK